MFEFHSLLKTSVFLIQKQSFKIRINELKHNPLLKFRGSWMKEIEQL